MGERTETRHLERFDPGDGTGNLIDSEHRGRYHWAARTVAGKDVLDAACGVGYGIEILAGAGAGSVTGVDIDSSAVAAAEERFGEHAAAVAVGDLRELPFEDDRFDVAVCFEAIEHVDEPDRALAELRRVLRSDGVLILSTPNPESYVPGNEYHVHEFRPDELTAAVAKHFANVAGYRQDAWLSSSIEAAESGGEDGGLEMRELLRTVATTDQPDYAIVVAGDAELPAIPPLIANGDTFDVRWWSEQLANSRGETAQALEREQIALKRLEETASALLDANQELSQIPVLRHRLEALEALHAEISERYHEMLGSTSWKITSPLRRARRSG